MASTNILYSTRLAGLSENENAQIGKLLTALRLVIEHESDNLANRNGVATFLFNIERSNKHAETIVNMDEFGQFEAVPEGEGAKDDTMGETSKKVIEHIQFLKEFAVTAIMREDSNYGVASDAKRAAQNFARAYYATKDAICEKALVYGTSASMVFNGTTVDLTTADNNPLFYYNHAYGSADRRGGTGNANYFYKNNLLNNASAVESALADLAVKLRNIKDENGEALGYIADTVIIPGNQPGLEADVKKVLGSQNVVGSGNNDINIQYGNMNLVILPRWQSAGKEIMVMSREANKNLAGNLFFNRIPLTVTNYIDNHTSNLVFNGRCRFGVGFGSYKHIVRGVQSADAVSGAASLS